MSSGVMTGLGCAVKNRPGRDIFLTVLAAWLLAGCDSPSSPKSGAGLAGLPPAAAEGIDLSHHNGEIDWARLSMGGASFVYIKATEGVGHVDTRFQQNWANALRHGWHVGAYHFYRLCQDGDAQAENFIRQVEVRADSLAPAVDLEYAHNCAPRGDQDDTIAGLRTFLHRLEAEYDRVPVIYTTPAFHADWLGGEDFARYPLWIRSLDGPPALSYAIWQYSMKGTLPGIEGPVDLNRAAP